MKDEASALTDQQRMIVGLVKFAQKNFGFDENGFASFKLNERVALRVSHGRYALNDAYLNPTHIDVYSIEFGSGKVSFELHPNWTYMNIIDIGWSRGKAINFTIEDKGAKFDNILVLARMKGIEPCKILTKRG